MFSEMWHEEYLFTLLYQYVMFAYFKVICLFNFYVYILPTYMKVYHACYGWSQKRLSDKLELELQKDDSTC